MRILTTLLCLLFALSASAEIFKISQFGKITNVTDEALFVLAVTNVSPATNYSLRYADLKRGNTNGLATTNMLNTATNALYQFTTNAITNAVSGLGTNGLYEFTTNLVATTASNSVYLVPGTNVTIVTNFANGKVTFTIASSGSGGGSGSTFNGAFTSTAQGTNYIGPLTNFLAKGAFAVTNDANTDNTLIEPSNITITSTSAGRLGLLNSGSTFWPTNILQADTTAGNNALGLSTNGGLYEGYFISVSNNFITPTNGATDAFVLTASGTGGATKWAAPTTGDSTNGLYSFTTNAIATTATNSVYLVAGTNVTIQTNFASGKVTFTVNSQVNAVPGGSDTQVQFNDAGSFGGDAGMTYNKAQDWLTVGAVFAGSIVLSQSSGSANPAILFTGDGDTGFYDSSSPAVNGSIGVTIDSVARWQFGDNLGAGHLLAPQDNTTDIGTSTGTRPRSGYFATSLNAPIIRASNSVTALNVTVTNVLSVSNNFVTPTNGPTDAYVLTASGTGGATKWAVSSATISGPYILDTNGFGTNTSFRGTTTMYGNLIWDSQGSGSIGLTGDVNSPKIYAQFIQTETGNVPANQAAIRSTGNVGTGLWWPASQTLGVMVNGDGMLRMHTGGIVPEVDNTVGLGVTNVTWKHLYVGGVLSVKDASGGRTTITNGNYWASGTTSSTNGFASYSTTAAVNIAATGWTNNFSPAQNATVFIDGTAVGFVVYNNARTAVYTNTSLVANATVPLQPNGAVVITTGTAVTGRAVPF